MESTTHAPIHVLHVVPGLLAGGMELTMAKVIRELDVWPLRHTIACLKAEPEIADLLPSDVAVHCLRARPNELSLPWRLAKLIRAVKPTVIHARNWGAWPDAVAANVAARSRVPIILSFHGLGKANFMPFRRRAASWVLARMSRALFTVSEQSKKLMVDRWGWPADKTEVIPNGVDTTCFVPSAVSRSAPRFVVGSVGNLRPVKNHALLVQACAALAQKGCDLELRIAGEGEERERLQALAQQTLFAERLTLAGHIKDVPAFLQELDVFVLSSDSEQHPNALNEAMSCGLPCVSTDVGCAAELLDEGRCGLLVPPGNLTEMTRAIGRLIRSPEFSVCLGKSARSRVCAHYSLERMLQAYKALYCRWHGPSNECS